MWVLILKWLLVAFFRVWVRVTVFAILEGLTETESVLTGFSIIMKNFGGGGDQKQLAEC